MAPHTLPQLQTSTPPRLDSLSNSDMELFNDFRHRRHAMNQEEFDASYRYDPPKHKYNEFTRRFIKFGLSYAKPFRSASNFGNTVLNFVPIFRWLPRYNWKRDVVADILGGCTVSFIHIPQGIAYAGLAGVDPIVGLYVSFFVPLFYTIFGTARQNSIGSFAVVALLARLAVDQYSYNGPSSKYPGLHNETVVLDPNSDQQYSANVVSSTLAFTVGIVHLLMAIFRLEVITTYFSDAVVSGFSTGAATHVFVTQLKDFFGLTKLPNRLGPGNLPRKIIDIAMAIPSQAKIPTMIISFFSITVLVVGKFYINPWVKKRYAINVPIPFELFLMISITAVSALIHANEDFGVAIVKELPIGLPMPHAPAFELVPRLIPNAFSICVVVAAIHISLAKMFGKKFNYKTDSGQELYALGFTSICASFFPVYSLSCSLSRTCVSVDAGTTTQLSALVSSAILGAVIVFFGRFLGTLPMCVLSSVIMIALTGMLRKIAEIKDLWPLSKYDCAIWVVSYGVTVCYDVTEGLFASITFALLTTVFRTQWPRWHYLGNMKGTTDFRDAERYKNIVHLNGIAVFRFDAPLLFTNVERFKDTVTKAALRWKNVHRDPVLVEKLSAKQPVDNASIKSENSSFGKGKVAPTLEVPPMTVVNLEPVRNLLNQHFIIDCTGFTFVDTMGVAALKELFAELRAHQLVVYFAHVKSNVLELFGRCGFYDYVPKTNFYPTIGDAVLVARHRQAQNISVGKLLLEQQGKKPYDPYEDTIGKYAVT